MGRVLYRQEVICYHTAYVWADSAEDVLTKLKMLKGDELTDDMVVGGRYDVAPPLSFSPAVTIGEACEGVPSVAYDPTTEEENE